MNEYLRSLFRSSLFHNSFFLLLATGVMAGFGFFFWLIVSHLFSTTNIGLATTLISAMNIIALLSLLGFDSAFVRFLPKSENPSEKINTGLIVVASTATILASGFIFFLDHISPSLLFVRESPLSAILFIFFCIMTAANILTDSVFLAERKTQYTLIINFIFSASRLLLPLILIGSGAMGIFSAIGISQTLGLLLSIWAMVWKFGYKPALTVSSSVLHRVKGYILGNYVAGILNLLPPTILPILITNHLGPEKAAFYYIIMMIGNLMYSIPWATTRSLFAEGSHKEEHLTEQTIKSLKITTLLLFPVIIVLYFFGNQILDIFGKNYSSEGIGFLQIIALSGIVVSIYSTFGAYFRVKKDPRWLIVINFFYAAGIIGGSLLFMPYGLVGIGYAWILGHILAIIAGSAILFS